MKKEITLLFVWFICVSSFSQNPDIDLTFGEGGFYQGHFGTGAVEIHTSAQQKDGKIVLVGGLAKEIHSLHTPSYNTNEWDFFLARITQDGLLDTTFGDNGFTLTDRGSKFEYLDHIQIDDLDRIYVIGKFFSDYAIGRFLPDGQVDITYGDDGFYDLTDQISGTGAGVGDWVRFPDNSIILGGGKNYMACLTKFNSDGKPDSSFGATGQIIDQFLVNEPLEGIGELAIQHDSLILALGTSLGDEGYIVRYLPNGNIDTTFADKGFLLMPVYQSFRNLEKIHVYPDQRFIVTTRVGVYSLHAFTADGVPDSSRFVNGVSSQPVNFNHEIGAIHVRNNGTIFLEGGNSGFVNITKLSSSGTLDTTFGFQGQIRFQVENKTTKQRSLIFLPGDSMLVLTTHDQKINTIRLDPQGNLDPTFYGIGYIHQQIKSGASLISQLRLDSNKNIWAAGTSFWAGPFSFSGPTSSPRAMISQVSAEGKTTLLQSPDIYTGTKSRFGNDLAIATDGSVYFTGRETGVDSIDAKLFVTKMLPGGQIDPNFGQGGVFHFIPPIASNRGMIGAAIRLQPDGKLVVAATLGTDLFFDPKMCLFRLHHNGTLDTSFNGFGYRIMGNPATMQEATDMELLADGSMIISGKLAFADAFSLAKALPNGLKDPQFGVNGINQVLISGANSLTGGKIAVKPDGKIIQAGSKDGTVVLVQYLPNGTFDLSFGANGVKSLLLSKPNSIVRDIAIAPSGETLVLGDFLVDGKSDIFIHCLDERGFPKSSFGSGSVFTLDLGGQIDYGTTILPLANGHILIGGASAGQATIVRLLSQLILNDVDDWQASNPSQPFIYPNPIATSATLQVELRQRGNLEVELLHTQGKALGVLFSDKIHAGKQDIALQFPTHLAQGYYLLKIQSKENTAFIKVLIKR